MALGGPGDVLVTGTTRELAAGAGFGFHERGAQSLKGVAGTWPVFAVSEVDGAPRTGPAEPDEAERRLAGVRPVAFRRRRGLAIVAGAVSLVGAAAVFALWAGVGGPPRLSGVPSDSVGRIDPETNAIEAALEVGSNPSGIAVDDGVAWVIRHEVGTIARLDDLESEGTDAGSTSTQGHPDAVGLDETGLVWVLNDLEGSVVRIDPRRVEIEGPPISLDIGTEDLAVGAGAVWVTNAVRRSLIRIDLVTNEVREQGIQGIGAPDGVAVGDGAIWVAGTKQVVKLDPTSMEKLDAWQLRSPGGDLAVGEGAVWVVQLAADQVIRIDQATGAAASVDVGNAPLNVAIGGGAVWVTNTSDGTVSKIDADNPNDVEEIRVGGSPEGVAFGDGSVWVTVH
jgi:YVTN family beta-propeller protein